MLNYSNSVGLGPRRLDRASRVMLVFSLVAFAQASGQGPAAAAPTGQVEDRSTMTQPEQSSGLRFVSIEPSVLFVREGEDLLQVADVLVANASGPMDVTVTVRCGRTERTQPLGKVPQGQTTLQVHVPDMAEPTNVEFVLNTKGKIHDQRQMTWQPQRHWEVYLVPISHHDWGYTAAVEDVLQKYDRIYDDVLRFCDETKDWPSDAQFRYTVEGAWSIQHFIESRPPEVVEKLGRYLREGRIEVGAFFGNEISGLCGHEELVRLMYPSFRIKRALGAPIRTASITDIPGLSWALPSLLADVGVKYFFAGLPTYFEWEGLHVPTFWDESAVLRHGRPEAFRWEGPDGRSVLVYYRGGYGCWGSRTYEQAIEQLPSMLERMQKEDTPFSVVRYGASGCGDNTSPSLIESQTTREWNNKWAYPRLIVATQSMFFEALDKQCSDVRTFRGELPHTDYAVGAASTAKETGINRISHDALPTAEKLTTLAMLVDGAPYPPPHLNAAYDSMLLYDEHTWGMARPAGPVQEWDWSDKARCAYKAAGIADTLVLRALDHIASKIGFEAEGTHLVVFNPLSFARTDVVRVSLAGWSPVPDFIRQRQFDLTDVQTGRSLLYQIVELDDPQAAVPFAAHRYALGQVSSRGEDRPPPNQGELFEIVFIAADVPSLGYRTYQIVPKEDTPRPSSSLVAGDDRLENRFFSLRMDPQTGAVASIVDKELSREIVDSQAPHKLNQFVARLVKDYKAEGPRRVTIRKGAAGPVYASLVVKAEGLGCPELTQEIVVYDALKRIDFNNRVLKNSTPNMEVYFAFPFKMSNPRFRFEGSDSVIRPFEDQFPGSNSNYYSMQHWAEVSDGQASVALSAIEAHLVEFGGLWPCRVSHAHHGVTPPHYAEPFIKPEQMMSSGHMYSFAMDSNFRTNFQPVQQSDTLFRYSLTVHKGEWPASNPRDFGWAVANPLLSFTAKGKRPGPLPASTSFCQVDPPNVLLTAMKQGEDGQGLILRLVETEGRASVAKVTLSHWVIDKAYRANLAEENTEELATEPHEVKIPVGALGIATIRLVIAK
jgi:hypothetical protein